MGACADSAKPLIPLTPQSMTTQELVTKLTAFINAGQNVQAEEELYADNVVSYEQDGTTAVGKAAVIAKTQAAFENIETFFGGGVRQAFVGTDSFLLILSMDMQPKGGARMQLTEYGYYRVADGKIVEERFFAVPVA